MQRLLRFTNRFQVSLNVNNPGAAVAGESRKPIFRFCNFSLMEHLDSSLCWTIDFWLIFVGISTRSIKGSILFQSAVQRRHFATLLSTVFTLPATGMRIHRRHWKDRMEEFWLVPASFSSVDSTMACTGLVFQKSHRQVRARCAQSRSAGVQPSI
ncbi:MAG: hypothetical protein ACYC4S_11680 [Rhodoferax sp.]